MRKFNFAFALILLLAWATTAWAGMRADRIYVGPLSGSTAESGRERMALSTSSTWTAITIRGGAAQTVPFVGILDSGGSPVFTITDLGGVSIPSAGISASSGQFSAGITASSVIVSGSFVTGQLDFSYFTAVSASISGPVYSGSAQFGPTTSYVSVDTAGDLLYGGDGTFWEDISIGIGYTIGAASTPDVITLDGTGIELPSFNGTGTPTNGEMISNSFEIPHSWKLGSTIYPHVYWASSSANTGTVQWGFEYTILPNGSSATTAKTQYWSKDTSGTAWVTQESESTGIVMVGYGEDTHIAFRLFRDPTLPGDTYPDDVLMFTCGLHFEIDRPGSRSRNFK